MNHSCIKLTSIAALWLAGLVPAYAASLSVSVFDLRSSEGQVLCRLFEPGSGFPRSGERAAVVAPILNSTAQCHFSGLAPGRYAVAIAHDANGNDRMDANFLGIPKEGFGFSRNVKPRFRPPTFSKAAITVAQEERRLEIRVLY